MMGWSRIRVETRMGPKNWFFGIYLVVNWIALLVQRLRAPLDRLHPQSGLENSERLGNGLV
jgi:hypothetical protein